MVNKSELTNQHCRILYFISMTTQETNTRILTCVAEFYPELSFEQKVRKLFCPVHIPEGVEYNYKAPEKHRMEANDEVRGF